MFEELGFIRLIDFKDYFLGKSCSVATSKRVKDAFNGCSNQLYIFITHGTLLVCILDSLNASGKFFISYHSPMAEIILSTGINLWTYETVFTKFLEYFIQNVIAWTKSIRSLYFNKYAIGLLYVILRHQLSWTQFIFGVDYTLDPVI